MKLIAFLKKSFQRPLVVLAALGIVLTFLCAILAPVIAPYDPMHQNLPASLRSPSLRVVKDELHILGTDLIGRDILSYIFYGFRISLIVGFGATAVSCILGVVLGSVAGFYGGMVGTVIMRAADFQLSIPVIVAALFVMALWGRGVDKLVLVMGITGWPIFARTIRAGILTLREQDYIEAAKATGTANIRILLRHMLPNTLTPILILSAVQLPTMIMYEATLSFLGMGVPVLTPSLGIEISQGQKVLYSGAWWVSVFPGLTLAFITVNVNILADWLRDVLDPKVR